MRFTSLRLRLAAGLGLTAVIGAALLLGLVALEYVVGAEAPLAPSELIHEVGDHVVAPLLVLLSVSAIAGWVVIERALAPLSRAAEDVDRAAQTAPRGVRIDAVDFPAEAAPFAAAVNRLLARLDGIAAAQEAFAADAAHELKTPLAVFALELERAPGTERLQADVVALSRLVDQLLLIARLDAQAAAETPKDEVDLARLGSEAVSSLAPIAVRAGRDLAFEDAGPACIKGRREAIAAALRNLIENALRVTPEGGTVTVRAGPGPVLAVTDGGAGVSPERLALLTRRTVRADYASPDGAGLGLAIVARIMTAHSGAVATAWPQATELRLVFPEE
jgi:signal transduction histidine kinase